MPEVSPSDSADSWRTNEAMKTTAYVTNEALDEGGIYPATANTAGFNVEIQTIWGRSTVLPECKSTDTVLQIKERYAEDRGIIRGKARNLSFVALGKELEDAKTLEESGITEEATNAMVVRIVENLIGSRWKEVAAINNAMGLARQQGEVVDLESRREQI